MTGGTWNLSGRVRAVGKKTPSGQPKGATLTIPAGVGQSLTYGTGTGAADLQVVRTATLGAGAAATYDLYTGTDLTDLFGDTAAFRKLKGLCVWVESGGDAAGVTVGNAASNAHALFFGATTHTHTVFPAGPPMLGGSPAGVAVDATHKNLKVINNGAVSVVVGIALAGSSA